MDHVSSTHQHDVIHTNTKPGWKGYFSLIKPGIVFGNVVPVVGGFLLAGPTVLADWVNLLLVMLATFCVVASSCLINNYFDRDLDCLMTRTQHRLLARKKTSEQRVLVLSIFVSAAVLLTAALYLLAQLNIISLIVGAFGFVIYAGLYTLYLKRHSVHQTTIGSLAGACPPVMGYTSLSGVIDIHAVSIFALFVFWQIAHSYAVAIFRQQDYAHAHVPLLPLVKGVPYTQKMMVINWALYMGTGVFMYMTETIAWPFLLVFAWFGLRWGHIAWQGLLGGDSIQSARRFFFYSIKVMLMFSLGIVLDVFVKNVFPSIYF